MSHSTISKIFSKKTRNLYLSMFVAIFIVSTIWYSSPVYNQPVHKSEFRFSERSKSASAEGSVLPASCASYPEVGQAHFVGDTEGHCSGTCPAGYAVNSIPLYKTCVYMFFEQIGEYQSIPCPPVSPVSGSLLISQNPYNSSICSAACLDGSWAIPHLGRSCPVPPPTANIYFGGAGGGGGAGGSGAGP